MDWKKLKTNNCPHCDGELIETKENFECQSCKFVIDKEKKISIETYRAYPEKAVYKIKWQNLMEEKCPICSSDLNYGLGPYEVLTCVNYNCSFKIRYDRMKDIINDPDHPCTQFYEREKLKKHGL